MMRVDRSPLCRSAGRRSGLTRSRARAASPRPVFAPCDSGAAC
jgi:hypothetical protein